MFRPGVFTLWLGWVMKGGGYEMDVILLWFLLPPLAGQQGKAWEAWLAWMGSSRAWFVPETASTGHSGLWLSAHPSVHPSHGGLGVKRKAG